MKTTNDAIKLVVSNAIKSSPVEFTQRANLISMAFNPQHWPEKIKSANSFFRSCVRAYNKKAAR